MLLAASAVPLASRGANTIGRHLLLLLLSLASAAMPGATGVAVGVESDFVFESWRTEQGLPQNSVQTITQTADGYLWIGTRFGLARFNGVEFRVFDHLTTGDLLHDTCVVLAEEPAGSLWIGTTRGLTRMEQGAFTRFLPRGSLIMDRQNAEVTGLPGLSITALCRHRSGGLWVGTGEGLALWDGRTFNPKLGGPGTNRVVVRALQEDASGLLWVGTMDGLRTFRLDEATLGLREVLTQSPAARTEVTSLHLDRSGRMWTGTSDGLVCHAGEQVTQFNEASNGLPTGRVTSILQDRSGNLWAAVWGKGLCLLEKDRFTTFTTEHGLTDEHVMALCEDFEGSLWVGTIYGGLNRLQRKRILIREPGQGPELDMVWCVCPAVGGGLWLTTEGGISYFDGAAFTNHGRTPGQQLKNARSICQTRDGSVWVGTLGMGLAKWREGAFEHLPLEGDSQPKEATDVRALLEGRDGTLWVGTDTCLARLVRGQLQAVPLGPERIDVRAIIQDRAGDLWVGTAGQGVFRVKAGNSAPETFTLKDGLTSDRVWVIQQDRHSPQVFWIGTDNGLNRLDVRSRKIQRYTREHGLFDNLINHLIEDDDGDLWISCNRGISRIRKAELNEVAAGTRSVVDTLIYGTADGMTSSETNGEHQPAGCRTADGHLWFPTTHGVAEIRPRLVARNLLPPLVVLERVLIDGEAVSDRTQPLLLPPGRARVLEFQYTGNSFIAPEKIQFRYRLEGHDEHWTEAGNRRIVHYTNLRPGRYRFQVLARNSHAVWNRTGAVFDFRLQPAFHQTPLFYALLVVTVVGGIFGLHQVRLRRQIQLHQLEQQVALEKERARIAQDMHDEVGSSLTQITLLSEMAATQSQNSPATRQLMAKIGGKARQVVEAMDEIVWAVNPHNDSLENLATYIAQFAREHFQPTTIRCRLDIPTKLPDKVMTSEMRHNVFLTFKEALNNIVKHAEASEVQVHLRVEDGSLEVAVEDNGRGLPPAGVGGTGHGLRNMKDRIAAIHGRIALEPREGGGTRVMMHIPLENP